MTGRDPVRDLVAIAGNLPPASFAAFLAGLLESAEPRTLRLVAAILDDDARRFIAAELSRGGLS